MEKKISNEGDCKIVNGGFFVINIVFWYFYGVLFWIVFLLLKIIWIERIMNVVWLRRFIIWISSGKGLVWMW